MSLIYWTSTRACVITGQSVSFGRMPDKEKLGRLRQIIQENIRVQKGGPKSIDYVDVSSALADIVTRQNHVIFGRRGCGKTLLLEAAERKVDGATRVVYINCEDYKQHSFHNVLIEVLDRVFGKLEKNLPGWFGRKRRSRKLITQIRDRLSSLKETADEQQTKIKEVSSSATSSQTSFSVAPRSLQFGTSGVSAQRAAIEHEYQRYDSKIHRLNLLLPELKERVRDFFDLSGEVKTVFIELDDFYHLPQTMQPHVADNVHRLCKDVPFYFKIGTLRHASILYADRGNQPTGAQERHDYQPIDVDFTLAQFTKTQAQLLQILYSFGDKAGLSRGEIDGLFMGKGFDRLVWASGGVPRDFLSLLLEALSQHPDDQPIGKDDIRQLSLVVFQRRIEELKADSEQQDQDQLLRGIYAIRTFCADKTFNVFLVADRILQEDNGVRELLNWLLDYRIVHSMGSALTHKTLSGTFHAYMIDIRSYANMRKLVNRFTEIDIAARDSRERMRNAPVLDDKTLQELYRTAPPQPEIAILKVEADESG